MLEVPREPSPGPFAAPFDGLFMGLFIGLLGPPAALPRGPAVTSLALPPIPTERPAKAESMRCISSRALLDAASD